MDLIAGEIWLVVIAVAAAALGLTLVVLGVRMLASDLRPPERRAERDYDSFAHDSFDDAHGAPRYRERV